MTEGFHGSPHPLQINVRIMFQTKPQALPHVFKFIIHKPSPFNTIQFQLQTAQLNNPQRYM